VKGRQLVVAVRRSRKRCALVGLGLALAVAVPAGAFDPVVESQNYNKGQERQTIYNTPQYQAQLTQVSQQNEQQAAQAQATDPERQFQTDLCARGDNGCAGDVRLYDWGPKGYGTVQPVLFTARDGATLAGHVWATRAGPATRPGIVITNGSVQAPERVYWYAAQTLAKDGFVVLTFDPQGQGLSDTQGEAPDQSEGTPAQSDGRPFVDGTEDAINFFLSNPTRPYQPVASCNSGTSHALKQDRRVKAGLDTAFNPYWSMLDPSRLGLAGHSYGALGVSYIGQWDPRVKAIVAWDNLGAPDPSQGINGQPLEKGCVNPANRTVAPVTKPGLGLSADYFIPPVPNKSDPAPLGKSQESLTYSKSGVDSGELIIRGGTHYDFDWIANPGFPATLRGADMIDWYTSAWFDKYVKGDCTADRRLLTSRWRADGEEAAIDQPSHDGNMFSFYYRSRLDFRLAGGQRYDNEDLRGSAAGLTSSDGFPGSYSYVSTDRSPDTANTSFGSCAGAQSPAGAHSKAPVPPCTSLRRVVIRLRHPVGTRVRRADLFVGKRRVRSFTARGAGGALGRLTVDLRGLARGTFTVRIRMRVVGRSGKARTVTDTRRYRTCTPKHPHRLSGPHRKKRSVHRK
jgi:dienelactone hydrolase